MGFINIRFLDTKRFSGIVLENLSKFGPNSLALYRNAYGKYHVIASSFDDDGNMVVQLQTSSICKRLARHVYRKLSDKLMCQLELSL